MSNNCLLYARENKSCIIMTTHANATTRGSTVLLCFCIITNMTKTVVCMLGQTQNCCYMLLWWTHNNKAWCNRDSFTLLLPCDVHSTVMAKNRGALTPFFHKWLLYPSIYANVPIRNCTSKLAWEALNSSVWEQRPKFSVSAIFCWCQWSPSYSNLESTNFPLNFLSEKSGQS